MKSFKDALQSNEILIFDGAMGTLLQAKGMPAGQSPEEFGLASPEILREAHAEYRRAGARVLTTNTFGGTRFKLGPGANARELNRALAQAARQAAGEQCFVAGSIGPTGQFVKPLGKLDFRDLVEAYREQIEGLAQGGVDLILAETHFDLAEVKAVAVAARLCCDLPLGLSMTFENEASLTGTDPLTFIDTAQNLGVDLVATNCSAGPDELYRVVERMLPRLSTPLLVEPNAGLPELKDGETVFPMGPEEFARKTARFVELGARALGGCCGSTPEHITRLVAATAGLKPKELEPEESCLVLTSRADSVPIGLNRPLTIIGERINPTGRKAFSEELQTGNYSQALVLAEEQLAAGARVLDVNVGAPMVDEVQLLPQVVQALTGRFKAPLCLDSSNTEALEAALLNSPGSSLLNSISGEPGQMERLAPLCKLHGAPCILLPIEGRKLPKTAVERIRVIESLVDKALSLGLPRRLLLIDVLVLTVSSQGTAARECFDTIRHCAQVLKLPTVMGLSNISFGLPARELINSAFLAMAVTQGLTSCIANPMATRLREMQAASDLLMGRDAQATNFIAGYGSWKPGGGGPAGGTASAPGQKAKAQTLEEAVIKGDKENILALVDEALERGEAPFELVDKRLIPAINQVGELYERREYFLPQLIQSAETMKRAFTRLRPLLEEEAGGGPRRVVILATVEGDIHDIGKNIVSLMLSNHGFQVEDLGKDVPARSIVAKAKELKACLIGLSALMTTTMVRMADTVSLLAEEALDIPVMVGGAVVTQAFAESINASYSPDAVSAVRLASRLTGMDS